MRFRQTSFREEPEINLVPFIDVLLVIVIFLAVTTTYAKFSQLKINLPVASAEIKKDVPDQIEVGVSEDGQYLINGQITMFTSPVNFASTLQKAARGSPEPTILLNADGKAPHQSVVNVMESAHVCGK